MLLSLCGALLLFNLNVLVEAHTWISCTNTYPRTWTEAMNNKAAAYDQRPACFGYPRGLPAYGPSPVQLSSDNGQNIDMIQAQPYTYIWNTGFMDQSNPTLANQLLNPSQRSLNYTRSFMAYMKQNSTAVLEWSAWDHQRNPRTPGTGLVRIYWAKDADLEKLSDLSTDKIIAEASFDDYMPSPASDARGSGVAHFPLALIDTTGAPLPLGRQSFVFAWFWKNEGNRKQYRDWPDFTTAFDIQIAAQDDPEADGGFFQYGNVSWASTAFHGTSRYLAYGTSVPLNVTQTPDAQLAAQTARQKSLFLPAVALADQPDAWVAGALRGVLKAGTYSAALVDNINTIHKTPTEGSLRTVNANNVPVPVDTKSADPVTSPPVSVDTKSAAPATSPPVVVDAKSPDVATSPPAATSSTVGVIESVTIAATSVTTPKATKAKCRNKRHNVNI